MIRWYFDKKEGMILSTFTGGITKDEIINYLREVSFDPELPRDLKIFEDASSAHFMFDIEVNEDIWAILDEIVNPFNSIKCASVHNTPKEVALATDYETGIPFSSFRFKIFANTDNAKAWLKASL